MRYVLLALAMLPAAATAGERAAPVAAAHARLPGREAAPCQDARNDLAVLRDEPVRIRRLDQEPLAGQYLGVMRVERGCDRPVKIADDIGRLQR